MIVVFRYFKGCYVEGSKDLIFYGLEGRISCKK